MFHVSSEALELSEIIVRGGGYPRRTKPLFVLAGTNQAYDADETQLTVQPQPRL